MVVTPLTVLDVMLVPPPDETDELELDPPAEVAVLPPSAVRTASVSSSAESNAVETSSVQRCCSGHRCEGSRVWEREKDSGGKRNAQTGICRVCRVTDVAM